MRRTKEDAAKTRQSVIDAALRLFGQRGYSGTTLRLIAAEAGCSRGPIYWHFANKEELFEAILAYSQLPPATLLTKVWGHEYVNDNHLLRLYITYLRKKIEPDLNEPRYIFSERGLGYRFVDFKRDGE